MKFLLLLLAGVAAVAADYSSLLRDAHPLLQKLESLPLELQHARSGQSLAEALDLPQITLVDNLETKIRTEFGQLIRELMEESLSFVSNSTEDANDELVEILNRLNNGSPMKESAQKFIEGLAEVQDKRVTIERILDYTFEERNLEIYTLYSIEERGIKDWWKKFKSWFSGLGSWISDKFDKFKNWAKEAFKKVIDAAKPIVEQVKDLAVEFLKENWDKITIQVVKQGLSFFHPYVGELGAKLTEALIKLARDHNLIPWEKFYLLLL